MTSRSRGGAALLLLALALALAAPPGAAGAAQPGEDGPEEHAPEVHVWVQAAGGDAFEVYLYDDRRTDVATFAARTTRALGGDAAPHVSVDPWDPDVATVQLGRRLVRRDGDALVWSPDGDALLRAVATLGYEEVDLVVCAPRIARSFDATRRPDDANWVEWDGHQCPGWHLSFAGEPLRLTLTLRPDGSRYTRGLLAPLALAVTALAVLAAGAAVALRRTFLPTLRGPATVVGLAAGAAAVLAVPATAAVLASRDDPIVHLVMADDLSVPWQVLLTVAPGLLAALPPLVFAVIVLRAPAPAFEVRRAAPAPRGPARGLPPWSAPWSPRGPGIPPWLAGGPAPAPTPGGAPPPPPGAAPAPPPAPPPRSEAPGPSHWPLEPPP